MNRSVFALALALLLVASVLVVPGAGSEMQSDEAPDDATTTVEVDIGGISSDHPTAGMLVGWTTRYEAPSAEAADRADDGTLDVSWFRGDEALEAVASNYPGSEVEQIDVQTRSDSGNGSDRTIYVYTRLRIDELFANDREQIVVGPTIANYLSEGDTLEVHRPKDWEPAEASVPGQWEGNMRSHFWAIGEDPEPRLVMTKDEADIPEGPLGSGPIVAVVALSLVTIALAARRRI